MGLTKEKVVDFERWTGKRKSEAVLDILSGKVTLIDFCRENDLRQSEVEQWLKDFTRGGRSALTQSSGKKDAQQRELEELKTVVGELSLENRVLKKSIELQEREDSES